MRNKKSLYTKKQEYIIEKESVPYIPVEYVFRESRAWNAITEQKNKTDQ